MITSAGNSNHRFLLFCGLGGAGGYNFSAKPCKFFNFKQHLTQLSLRRGRREQPGLTNTLDPSTTSGISPCKKALLSTTQTILLPLFSISVIFKQGVVLFPPPTQGHLAMSGDIFGCHTGAGRVCYWHLVGGGQGSCSTSYNARDSSHNKELFSPKCQ